MPRGQDPAAPQPTRRVELCLWPIAILLCPKHLRLSSHLVPWGEKRAGHSHPETRLMISANPSSSQQLPQKEIQPQKPLEAPAASISRPPLTKDEPLCKLPALGTDAGCQCCAQVVRVTARPLAQWDLQQLLQARAELTMA